ncbi:MAG: asparagine--tRNA ligase, partial [Planctomycetia bacterium]|nr:asparagine--tRNA ligase [Planctomycetia bacterium]
FQVTTMDMERPPRIPVDRKLEDGTPDPLAGQIDWSKDFFGCQASLTVSGQLSAETYACALGRVYTFGPTFRAENSNTPRHLSEFWMVEPEAAFFELEDNMSLAERMLRTIFRECLEHHREDLEFFNKRIDSAVIETLEKLADSEFLRITYTDAVDILKKSGRTFEFPVDWGADLQSEHERFLTEQYFRQPVIVSDYPKEIKAFYMKLNDDGRTVRAMDVLVPRIGEIIGGSQREDRLDVLLRRMDELGLDPEAYGWYLDLRRYGTVPHSGFGLGLERIVQFVTGMENIRDVIPFPRYPGNADF